MSRPLRWLLAVTLVLGLAELAWYVTSHVRSSRRISSGDLAGLTPVDVKPAQKLPPPEPIPPPRQLPPVPRSTPLLAREPVSLTRTPPTLQQLRTAAKTANVVICVLDAARADHFGCYGYPRDTTPNFDRLAAHSVVFDQHFCQHTQTTSSTVSLLTSQYPDTHGVLGRMGQYVPGTAAFGPQLFTIEKGLRGAGYGTFLFSSNLCASPQTGVGTDFDHHKLLRRVSAQLDLLADQVASGQGRPFFAYVHLMPPHGPYDAPPEMDKLFRDKKPPGYREGNAAFTLVTDPPLGPPPPANGPDWVNLYDANLRWADWAVGEIERMLKQAGIFDSTLLIVTADHGEAFREHGYEFHTTCPYDEVTHIPLLIKFPGGNGPVGRVRALTETVDVTPTVLDLLGVGYPRNQVQGASLLPLLTGEVPKLHDYVHTRTLGYSCEVIRSQRAALLLYRGGKLRALYDLERDPGMTWNVLAQKPQEAAELTKAFREFAARQAFPPLDFLEAGYVPKQSRAPELKLSDETRRELRAMGYIK